MSGFRIGLALTGDLAAYLDDQEWRIALAATAASKATGKQVQAWYREALVQAGMGNKLPRTIRTKTYPATGASLSPATLIWSNAPHILAGLAQATTISGTGGNWLAIPTEHAPKRLMRKRITPEVYEQRYGAGRLQFVSLVPGRSAMLVDNDLRVRKHKGKTKCFIPRTEKSWMAAVSMPIFWLVRQVRTKAILSIPDLETRGQALLEDLVGRRVAQILQDDAPVQGAPRSRATGPRSRRR